MNGIRRRVIIGTVALALAAVAAWLAIGGVGRRQPPPPPAAPAPVTTTPAALTRPPRPQRVLPPGRSFRLVVLMYHHIAEPPPRARGWVRSLYLPSARFEHDLQRLQQNRCFVTTMARAYELMAEDRLPRNTVVLTFDDGYRDNYDVASPLLRRYGMNGTFNIVTSTIDEPTHMTREQLRELVAGGNEIGCHTMTHPDLRQLSARALEREVAGAKQDLEKLLGGPVVTFCYPAGDHDGRVVRAVASAGYEMGLVTGNNAGRFDTSRPFEIGRYRVTERKQIPASLLHDQGHP